MLERGDDGWEQDLMKWKNQKLKRLRWQLKNCALDPLVLVSQQPTFSKLGLVMMMVFWLKLVELRPQLNLTSNPLCLMFKHPTATNLWEPRSASRELGISSTILAEVSKLLVLN